MDGRGREGGGGVDGDPHVEPKAELLIHLVAMDSDGIRAICEGERGMGGSEVLKHWSVAGVPQWYILTNVPVGWVHQWSHDY